MGFAERGQIHKIRPAVRTRKLVLLLTGESRLKWPASLKAADRQFSAAKT
jgi:hypothetical protein